MVIWIATQYAFRAVKLLKQEHPSQLMGEGHGRKAHGVPANRKQLRRKAMRTPDDEARPFAAQVQIAKKGGKAGGVKGPAAFIQCNGQIALANGGKQARALLLHAFGRRKPGIAIAHDIKVKAPQMAETFKIKGRGLAQKWLPELADAENPQIFSFLQGHSL